MDGLLIVGGGGHAREVADLVVASGRHVRVHVEEPHLTGAARRLWEGRGVELLTSLVVETCEFVVAVGDPGLRSRLAADATAAGHRPTTLVSAHAVVSGHAVLGLGSVVFPHALVSSEAVLGSHTHLNQGARVSHDAVLGEFVTLGPNACVTGGARVGDRATIGAGALVLPGVEVGADAVVGAGAVVVRDVAAGATVKGNPAR